MLMPGSKIRYERPETHIARIVLDRPDKRNAIDGEMTAMLDTLVKRTESDPAVRVVILAAAGDVFCAGADLQAVATGEAATLRSADGGFAGLTLADHVKPWIAAVSGPALAGGLEIVLACDMVLAVPTASFGLPEVRRGLVAGAGGIYRLPRAVPRALAIEMIATGLPIDAARAGVAGLVNRIVEPADLAEAALTLARTIAANAPTAVRESLAIARVAQQHDDATLRMMAATASDRVLATGDVLEGAAAFIEGRPPVWRDS
jgi:enoyl-CoA hydratase/carnithine racemase